MRKTTTDLILRPRRPSDDGFIYRLSNRVFGVYSIHPKVAMTSMIGEADARVMVAEHGDEPVGFFVVGFERLNKSFGPWRRPSLSRLNAIAVEPDLHGRGVGSFLLDHAEEVARDQAAVSMTLMTAETNTRARKLFKAHGFQELMVLEHAYARGQRGVVMTKTL